MSVVLVPDCEESQCPGNTDITSQSPVSLHWLSWHSHHLAWPRPATSISWQNKDWILILSLHLYIRKRNRYFVAENLTAAPIRWLLSGDLLRFKAYKLTDEEETFYKSKVIVDMFQAYDICKKTITHSKSEFWFQQRKIRITASKAHSILR